MKQNGFVRELRRDIKDKTAIKRSLKFLLAFVLCFVVLMFLVFPLFPGFWDYLGKTHAKATHGIISWFGADADVNGNILSMDVGGVRTDFEISRLCSGDIEIALLAALLLASFDVLLIWRLLGIFLGTLILIFINPLRIAITLLATKDSGMEAGDFYHSVIFRLFLFVLLVLYYFAWYRAFAGRGCLIGRFGCPLSKMLAKVGKWPKKSKEK